MERSGTVAIVGVGLIGGSIGLALRARGLADRVIGIGRDETRLGEALLRGAIDEHTTDLVRGVAGADVVVVCTPVTRIARDVRRAARHGPDRLLITDAGSTKGRIVARVERDDRARAAFVGGHPIAGSERTGVAHARADLFEGAPCVLTPTERTPSDRLRRARAFWERIGCWVVELAPMMHDETLALTSHLPHAVAAALAASVPSEAIPLTGGAYRDGTRVAGSDAPLWAGIFRENRMPVLMALRRFRDELARFESALMQDDGDAIVAWWQEARGRRSLFEAQAAARGGDG